MDVLYTVNNKYVDIMLTSLYSLIKNGNLPYLNLHIVESNFSDEDYKRINNFVNCFENIKLNIYKFDYDLVSKYNIPEWRGSQISNARLFYPRIIKDRNNDINNLLYLDSDTIVVNSLNDLAKNNNHMLSACIDESSSKSYYIDKLGLSSYYNSGVLYFNVDKFLNYNIEDKISNFVNNSNIELIYPDQDLLNILLSDNINTLKPRYNMSAYSYTFSDLGMKIFYDKNKRQLSYDEIILEKQYKTILHSYGIFNIKPWTNNNINPFNEIFMSYMNYVNDNFKKEDLDTMNRLLSISPFIFKNLIFLESYFPRGLNNVCREISLKLKK